MNSRSWTNKEPSDKLAGWLACNLLHKIDSYIQRQKQKQWQELWRLRWWWWWHMSRVTTTKSKGVLQISRDCKTCSDTITTGEKKYSGQNTFLK